MYTVEVRREGTLIYLFINGEARECATMHTFDERVSLFIKARDVVRQWSDKENTRRKLLRQNAVTLESFYVAVTSGDTLTYCLFDGSKSVRLLWP